MVDRKPSRIALAQTTSTDDFDANLAVADAMVEQAAAGGAELLAFPEVFLFVGGRRGKLAIAEPLDGPVVSRFREAAARHGMMILLGSIHERIGEGADKVRNTALLLGANGDLLASYRKLKLFDVDLPAVTIKESDTIEAGCEPPPVVDTPLGRVGLSICFDLRYPALYSHLRRQGADIICVPSNFTFATGSAHWELLLRARAVETQCYVLAPAQFGRHNDKYTSYGHSCVVDPWGTVLALAPERTGLVFAEIDLDYLARVRRHLPMTADVVPAGGGRA